MYVLAIIVLYVLPPAVLSCLATRSNVMTCRYSTRQHFISMEQVWGSVGDCESEGLERAEHDFGII